MDSKGGMPQGGGDGGVMNQATGIDMYTLMCIKLMTNKKLLYTKVNKIQKQTTNKTNKKSNLKLILKIFLKKQPSRFSSVDIY